MRTEAKDWSHAATTKDRTAKDRGPPLKLGDSTELNPDNRLVSVFWPSEP